MRKLYIVGLIALAAVIIGLAWAEQLTFSTYYPAPAGVYNQMVTRCLGVGDQDGDGLNYADAPDPSISGQENDLWVAGQVGIGTTAPDSRLHIYNGSAGSVNAPATTGLTIENNGDTAISFLNPSGQRSTLYFGDAADNDIGQLIYTHGNNSMRFHVNAQERMRIASSGNVGIGTAGPQERLDIVDASGDGAIKVGDTDDAADAGTIRWTGTAFEGYNGSEWVPLGGGVSFGNRTILATVSTTVNAGGANIDVAATQAATAGELICVLVWTGGDGDQMARAVVYSDSNPNPSTALGHAFVDYCYSRTKWASCSLIVKKDDYYKAEWKGEWGNNAPVTRTYYWLPIGN